MTETEALDLMINGGFQEESRPATSGTGPG